MNKRQRVVINKPNYRAVSNSNRHWREISYQVAALFAAVIIVWSIVTTNTYHGAKTSTHTHIDSLNPVIKYTLPEETKTDSSSRSTIKKIEKDLYDYNSKAYNIFYKNISFYVYRVAVKEVDIKLYWKDFEGNKFKSFSSLKQSLEREKKNLIFAMNGGIYSKSNDPVGLYIENGIEHFPLVKDTIGFGNFFMQPNGVFAFSKNRALILPTHTFSKIKHEQYNYAIQSGPMLLIDNTINKKFDSNSSNKFIRNGVGIDNMGQLYFVISDNPVNFYEIASFFKNKLNCLNALYLDGSISNMYLPELNLNDLNGDFGSIIGITIPNKL